MTRVLLSLAAVLALAPALPAQSPPSYAKQVRPFLAKYCLECHNAKSAKLGLNLETAKAILDGSDSGPVLEPGQPDKSRIVLLVEGKDKPPMPPKEAKFHPKKEEIGILRAWVAAGAKNDSAEIKVVLPEIKPRTGTIAPIATLAYSPTGEFGAGGSGSRLRYYHSTEDHATNLKNRFHVQPVDLSTFDERTKWWSATDTPRITALSFVGVDVALGVGSAGKWGDLVAWPRKVRKHVHDDVILDMAVSSQGVIATASYDTRIGLTDVDFNSRGMLKEHSDAVYGVAFSPDGKQLASCSADRAVKVFDVATGKLLYTLGEATDWLYTVAWSPDGKYLASAGVDKSIRVYRPGETGAKLVHSVFAHQEPVQKILFSKDSKTLYSLGQGGTLKSWDVERMVERKVYDRQPETVLCMALRPDGKQIALGRYDGVVVLLDEATGKVQAKIGATESAKKQAAAPPKKIEPKIKQITPAAVVRGRSATVRLAGDALDELTGISTTIPGAKVVLRPGSSVEMTVPASTTPGGYKLQGKSQGDASVEATIIVDAYDVVPEKDAGGSPATGQKITLPTTITGSIDRAGDVDFYRFEAKAGQQLGVQIIAAAVGSKLEPSLQLIDLAGGVLADSSSGHLGHTFAKSGTYAIGVYDRELRGGPNMHYRLNLGEIPVVTAIFPLGLQRGTDADIRVQGVFLATDRIHVKAPGDAASGSKVGVPLTTPRGTPLGNLQATVGEFPEVKAGSIAVPGTANGVIAEPGTMQVWPFHAKKGQQLIVEVEARRVSSDLDSYIEILDKNNQPVARAVLRCQAKTFVTFRDHDSRGGGIRLDAWSELGTNDYLYVGNELMKIQDLPPNPDADCTFFNTAGQRLGYLDTTPTHHAMGTPMYKVSMHPPGTTFPPNGFPVFTLYYRNDDGGPGYGRDSRIFFDPPADGEYRVRIRDARGLGGPGFGYRLTVRPPRPSFNVRFNPTAPAIFRGGAAQVTVSADRIDGYDGPIAVHFANVPPGLSVPPTVIEAGTFSTTVAMFAEPSAKLPDKLPPLKLIGEALIDGQKQVKEAAGGVPTLREPGDLVTVTDESEVILRPGEQVKLTVHIERRNGFAGRVPVEVRGLPHGVHALDIGLNGILINENETRRTIVIYAEPWVQLATHPFVVLSRSERNNTEHGARSVLLKIK
jgi:WD40 repeat protein